MGVLWASDTGGTQKSSINHSSLATAFIRTKTKELVVCRAIRRSPIELANPLIQGAERVLSLRVLGDTYNTYNI